MKRGLCLIGLILLPALVWGDVGSVNGSRIGSVTGNISSFNGVAVYATNLGTDFEVDSNSWTLTNCSRQTGTTPTPIAGSYSAYGADTTANTITLSVAKTVTLSAGMTISAKFKGYITDGADYQAVILIAGSSKATLAITDANSHTVSYTTVSGDAGSKSVTFQFLMNPYIDGEAFATDKRGLIDDLVVQ